MEMALKHMEICSLNSNSEKRKVKLPYFAVYNALPCIMRTHDFGPNFQGNGVSTTHV